ncbi:MAG: site-specific DNA-methyltransferase [Planctomycetes bacterium]|nr:site-specific DNA-methyltransferase [Planctomycetota bacterium]
MNPYYEKDGITIYHGDCRHFLSTLSCDLLLTDPPYNIQVGSAFKRGDRIDNGDAPWNRFDLEGWEQMVTARKWAAVFRARQGVGATLPGLVKFHQYYLVKTNPPPTPRPTFVSAVEECDIFRADGVKWHGSGYEPNRWIGPCSSSPTHPAEKPLNAIIRLVGCLSEAGEMVLDPFVGSGTTLVAAKSLGRRAIGIEIEEKYCEVAAKRLGQSVMFGADE